MLTLLLIVAIWRTTRLLVRDEFPPIRAIREWFITSFATVDSAGELGNTSRWGAPGRSLAYLWTCTWCMSVWVGAALVALADWRLDVPLPWLVVAAGSAASGLLNLVEVEHDQRVRLRELSTQRMEAQR